MTDESINNFISRLIARTGGLIESIAFYPHPFTGGGLVIVAADDAPSIPDLISEVYRCDPPALTLTCLRSSELFQLSSPGVFGWPDPLEEKPHLAFYLKNKGVMLYGRDILCDIKLPADPSSFLESHLQRCKQFVRNWALDQLRRRNYLGVVKELERQTRYLMATALLTKNELEPSSDALPAHFRRSFVDSRANQAWEELDGLARHAAQLDAEASRESAFEALWLFEQFLLQMTEHQ